MDFRLRDPLPRPPVGPSEQHGYVQVTVAATSIARFSRICSALSATGYGGVQSVFIVGIAPPPTLIESFAPTTGTTNAKQMSADALRRAERVAREAAALLPATIGVRHCSTKGWGDGLVRLLTISECQCLLVDRSDVRGWRVRGLRRRLGRLGVALVVVDAE